MQTGFDTRHLDHHPIDPDYNHHHDHYHWHGGWHHGCWGGHWGAWWNHMWTYHPVASALGLTMWGINRSSYWYGYETYYNPYYVEPTAPTDAVPVDYSQPLSTYEQEAIENPPSDDKQLSVSQVFDRAREDFLAGKYDDALTRTNKALAGIPGDPVMNEFRALVLFAQGKYSEAAATIHSVLAVGPGWDWTTLVSLYPSASVYQQQLGKLEDYVLSHDGSAPEHFLLGYHYLTEGHADAAARQFQKVVAAQPKDAVAAQMLEMLEGPKADPAAKPADEAPAIPVADLVGTWTSQGASGDTFSMVLDTAGKFTWTYKAQGKETTVEGVFAIESNTLAMEPDAGGTMVAEITPPKNGQLHFQMVGGPPDDKGLVFKQQ
jgi:tetratricopeptide (TPR) repeat protein